MVEELARVSGDAADHAYNGCGLVVVGRIRERLVRIVVVELAVGLRRQLADDRRVVRMR